MIKTIKIACTIEVPFETYSNNAADLRARRRIYRYVKDALRDNLDYIPFHIEKYDKDDTGDFQSKKTKITTKIVSGGSQ